MIHGPDISDSDEEGFSDDPEYYDLKAKIKAQDFLQNENSIGAQNLQNKEYQLKKAFTAITLGKTEEFLEVLKNGLDFEAKLEGDWTFFLLAASYGNDIIIEELIKKGISINSSKNKKTALMFACNKKIGDDNDQTYNSYLATVKCLIKYGADPKLIDNKRRTALMMAADSGNTEIVEFLLPLSEIFAEDNQKWTALFWAVNGNHLKTVAYLLTKGYDVNKLDIRNQSILDVAIQNGGDEILNLLETEKEDDFFVRNNYVDLNNEFYSESSSKSPHFLSDIYNILHGTRTEALMRIITDRNVTLLKFLMYNDRDLKEIGVCLPYQRNRVLGGLYKFHKRAFHAKSLPLVAKNDIFSNLDVAKSLLTCVKQMIAIEASLEFIQNHLEERSLLELMQTIQINDIRNIKNKIKNIQRVTLELTNKIQLWDTYLGEPVDLINSKRRNIKWGYLYATSITTVIIFSIAHQYFR